jgi:perosamine synthetase
LSLELFGPWITDHEINTVMDAVKNGWYGEKKFYYVETFEADFARHHGRRYALMTPNCTSALHLLLAALGVEKDDEVIVPECTWIATSAPIKYVGAQPVFADIDNDTWCLSPKALESAITSKTKAVIVVDVYGNMPEMDALLNITTSRGIPLIEDAAEALGSKYKGKKAGSFGLASVFSFHRTKTITTGEGGMLLTDDDALFERCRFLRDHGRGGEGKYYFNTEVAFKYMPFNLQAALGYAQLQRIDELVGRKRWIRDKYVERLNSIPDIYFNHEPSWVYNSVWCTTMVMGESHGYLKEPFIESMDSLGLPVRPFFYPLSSMPAYSGMEEAGRKSNPKAYDLSSRGVILPSAFNLTEEQIQAVCDGIRSVLNR